MGKSPSHMKRENVGEGEGRVARKDGEWGRPMFLVGSVPMVRLGKPDPGKRNSPGGKFSIRMYEKKTWPHILEIGLKLRERDRG